MDATIIDKINLLAYAAIFALAYVAILEKNDRE